MIRSFNACRDSLGVFALSLTLAASGSAQGLPTPDLEPGQFVVSAQVVSDTLAAANVPADASPSAANVPAVGHAGDIDAQPAGLIRNLIAGQAARSGVSSGQVSSGQCADGNCGGGIAAGAAGGGNCAGGNCRPRTYPQLHWGNLHTNGCNQANAQMYTSPIPVPPNVGHTFIPYQPFSPHHLLYHHTDRYHNYSDDGRGLNRTRARYYSPPIRQAASNIYWNFLRLPR